MLAFQNEGYAWARDALDEKAINALIAMTQSLCKQNTYGIRNLCDKLPRLHSVLESSAIRSIVEPILGSHAFLVRSIFFDKMPHANWHVPWHQDTAIAVKKKIPVPGFGVWSVKEGVDHVEPYEALLSSMLTLRIHLDPTTTDNGALRVMPGSHQLGRIPSAQILAMLKTHAVVDCTASPGDVLIMQPLLCHASRKVHQVSTSSHRRIIHIEYANQALPSPLEWYERA